MTSQRKTTSGRFAPAVAACLERAELHQASGRLAEAAAEYHAALEQDPGPRSQLAYSRFLWQSGCFLAAESLLRQAVDRALQEQDDELLEVAAANLASVLRESGRRAEAASWQQRSLAAAMKYSASEETSTSRGTPEAEACDGGIPVEDLLGLAADAVAAGKLALAQSLASRALEVSRCRQRRDHQADAWGTLGLVALLRGETDSALTLLGRAFRLHCDLRDAESAGRDLLNLAETCHRIGRWHSAVRCLKQARLRFREAGCVRLLEVASARMQEAERFLAVTTQPATLN